MSLIQSKRRFRAASLTPAAVAIATQFVALSPVAHAEEKVGFIDVTVDTAGIRDAVSYAESTGVTVVRENSVIRTGDSEETKTHIAEAENYYKTTAESIRKTASDYVAAVSNYESEVARNEANAEKGNSVMDGLAANAGVNGQTVIMQTKQYVSEADVQADAAKVQAQLAKGTQLDNVNNAIDLYNIAQNAMVGFQTQSDMGNVKIQRQTVKISDPSQIDRYRSEITRQYEELNKYVAGLSAQSGTIADSAKPTYTLYDLVVDDSVVSAANEPVTIYRYTAIPVDPVPVPTVTYHYYNIRSQPTTSSVTNNADGELINATDKSGNGTKVVQAMVNQVVGIETDNQPLPSERIDRIHHLSVGVKIPANAELDRTLTKSTDNWTLVYDDGTGMAKFVASDKYLVKINENQTLNNTGEIANTVRGEWVYEAPAIFFKLLADDTTYQTRAETIVNHEYLVEGNLITIRTDSADPSKRNTNSKYVNIDGKAVLPGSINNYEITMDFDQYRGVNIDRAMQSAGIRLYDFYPSDAVDLTGPIQIMDAATGEVIYTAKVSGDGGAFTKVGGGSADGVTWSILDTSAVSETLQKAVEGKTGTFLEVAITGYDNEFYKNYVEAGRNVVVRIPMTTKKIDNTPDKQGGTYNGNSYSNIAFQSDFGNEYKTNEVTNTVPLLDPRKDAVLTFANLTSMDINANPTAEIEHNTQFYYRLSGSKLPTNLSEDTFSYVVTDELHTADEYNGFFLAETGTTIYFKPGTTLYSRYGSTGGAMPANSDISRYFTQTIARNVSSTLNTSTQTVDGADTRVTRVQYKLDEDFISQIDFSKTEFQVDIFVQSKRVKDEDGVTNIFNEVINGIDFGSNQVVTNSKINALDKLAADLEVQKERLDDNFAADAELKEEFTDFREYTVSALSVIVKDLSDFKTSTNAALTDLAAGVKDNSDAIEAVTDVVIENATNIAENRGLINNLLVRMLNTETKLDETAAQVDLNTAAVRQSVSTLTIYAVDVLTDAEAHAYAVNRGVNPGAIKSIALNEDGRYVVTYNTAEGSINSSPVAATKPVNSETVAKQTIKIEFYNIADDEALTAKLEEMGYTSDHIITKSNNNGKYTVFIDKLAGKQSEVVAGIDTEPAETEKISVTLPVVNATEAPAAEAATDAQALQISSALSNILRRISKRV